jgi:uncharacterized protein YlzI (FlbEa/FlbD family)
MRRLTQVEILKMINLARSGKNTGKQLARFFDVKSGTISYHLRKSDVKIPEETIREAMSNGGKKSVGHLNADAAKVKIRLENARRIMIRKRLNKNRHAREKATILALQGKTIRDIAKELAEQGFRNPDSSKPYTHGAVQRWIKPVLRLKNKQNPPHDNSKSLAIQHFVARMLKASGMQIKERNAPDITIELGGKKIIVEVKAYGIQSVKKRSRKVGLWEINQVASYLEKYKADFGMILTTGSAYKFIKERKYALASKVFVIDGADWQRLFSTSCWVS